MLWSDRAFDLGPIRVLTPLVLECLGYEDMFDDTAEVFIQIFVHFPEFFTPSDYSSLSAFFSSPSAKRHFLTFRSSVSGEVPNTYVRLICAYGEAAVHILARECEQPNSKQVLDTLLNLLGGDGDAITDAQYCSQCLDFWSQFTDFLAETNSTAGDNVPGWMERAKTYVTHVIRACWWKVRIPQPGVFSTWSRWERDAFHDLRSDVTDFLQQSYALLGLDMFNDFALLALEALTNHAWLHLEATLFCLNALSDSILDEHPEDEALSRIFGSSLFADLTSATPIPPDSCTQTAISLITNYTSFFERHSDYLPSTLNFLFESVKSPTIAHVAAKAIQASCQACRTALVSQLAAFLYQYEILLTRQGVEAITKERVIGAIAAIVQAIPSEEERLNHLDVLLKFVEQDVQASVNLLGEGRDEESQAHGLCALQCLVNIGKGFQAPDDVVIDLEANVNPSTLWAQGTRNSATQEQIVRLMDIVINSRNSDSDVMEAACKILRTGYKEVAPGPFVFPPSVTENFVLLGTLKTARLDYMLDTAGVLLSTYKDTQTVELNHAALAFLHHVLDLIHAMEGKPRNRMCCWGATGGCRYNA